MKSTGAGSNFLGVSMGTSPAGAFSYFPLFPLLSVVVVVVCVIKTSFLKNLYLASVTDSPPSPFQPAAATLLAHHLVFSFTASQVGKITQIIKASSLFWFLNIPTAVAF